MASKKRMGAKAATRGAKVGTRIGARVAPKAGRAAGRTAWRAGRVQTKLARRALSSREPRGPRYLRYGFFALVGLAIGALISRFGNRDDTSSSFTGTTGQRGETWGTGTPTSTAGGGAAADHQQPEDLNRTGPERSFSDPSSGPLIGTEHSPEPPEIPVQHEEVENRIRTRIGEDPRTMDMPHVNVEVNDGVAELRGVAASEDIKQAAGEIAASIEGVSEVRNLITVGSS